MDNGNDGVFQNVLPENFPFGQAAAPGELDVIGVHLIDHIPPQPLHQVGDGGQGQGDDGQHIHKPGGILHIKGRGQSESAAQRLEQENIGKGRNRGNKHNIERADVIQQLILPQRHDDANRHTDQIGQEHGDDADGEGVADFGHAVLICGNVGVIIHKAGLDHGAAAGKRAGDIGSRVQVVGRLGNRPGGIGHGGIGIGALGFRHGLEHVNTLADGVGKTQVDLHQVLVNEGEGIIKIEQILILRTRTHHRRRELFAAVNRVMEGEGNAPILDLILHIVDVIDGDQVFEIVDKTHENGDVPVGVQARLAAVLIFLGLAFHFAVQTDDLVALGFIFLGEAPDKLRGLVAVLARLVAKGDGSAVLLLGDLVVTDKLAHIVRVGNVIHIAIAFPLLHHVCFLGVGLHAGIHGVGGKNQVPVQCGVDHHHDDADHDYHRENTPKDSVNQISRHRTSLISLGDRRAAACRSYDFPIKW